MNFVNAEIYGFSKWANVEFDFTSEPFITFYGKNEAGKSSLQAFIHFMLFGLPPRKRKKYRSKQTGVMGGQLRINDPEIGEYVIKRIDEVNNGAASCITSNGEVFDEDWLRGRLGNLTEEIFLAIFSFTAMDLAEIKSLNATDLTELLLGIGLTGSTAIYEAEKNLNQTMDKLFKRYGTKPLMNQQLTALQALEREQNKLAEEERTYQEKRIERASISSELEKIREDIAELKLTTEKIDKQLLILPIVQEVREINQELAEEIDEKFPVDGISRYETVKNKLLPLSSELASKETNLLNHQKAKKNQLALLANKNDFIEVMEEVNQKQNALENEQEIKALEQQIEKNDSQIHSLLKELNIGLTKTDLAAYPLSFSVEKTWGNTKAEKEKFNLTEKNLVALRNDLKNKRNNVLNRMEVIEVELVEEEVIEQFVHDIKAYQLQKDHQADVDFKVNKWKNQSSWKYKRTKQILFSSIILAVLAAISGFVFTLPFLYNLAIVLVVIGVGQWWLQKQWLREATENIASTSEHLSSLTENEITEKEQKVNKQRKNLAQLDHLKHDLNELSNQLNEVNTQVAQIEKMQADLTDEINKEYEKYPFLKSVQLMYWPDLYLKLQRIKHLADDEQDDLKKRQELIHNKNENLARLKEVRSKIQSSVEISATIWESYRHLEEFINTQTEIKSLIHYYQKLMAEVENDIQALKKSRHVYEGELADLLAKAGVDSEEEFYQKSTNVNHRKQLRERLQSLITQLNVYFSKADWQSFLEQNVTEIDLQTMKNEFMEKLQEKESDYANKQERLAHLSVGIGHIEASEAYSASFHQIELEKDKLLEQVKEWLVSKAALEILQRSKLEYRNKYMDEIILKTTAYFQRLTNYAYTKIIEPNDDEPFKIIDKKGIIYLVDELSKGTIDQLHISLKLAISQVMNQKFNLPLLVDDAFVHFDQERANLMLDILAEISQSQQVIFFTCHERYLNHNQQKSIMLTEEKTF